MNNPAHTYTKYSKIIVAFMLASVAVHAQTVSSSDTSLPTGFDKPIPVQVDRALITSTQTDNDIVVMSPFEVQAERDVGFVAASSLAGGRLAGDLKDTPVAYSVLTKEFIEALQLNDLTDLAKWAPNSNDDPRGGREYGNAEDLRITSRGVGSNSPQRNFFPVFFNFDSYNIERLDLARGPNAVLFGTSALGGTPNSMTKRASTDKRKTEIRTSYSSWANFRATLDHNQPLNKELAFRLNALYQDRNGWRDPDAEERKGITLAATWKVAKNTEIRAEAERGSRKTAITLPMTDFISGWDGTYYTDRTTTNDSKGVAVYGATGGVIYTPSSGDKLVNYQGRAYTRGGNATANVPAGGSVVVGSGANIQNYSILEQLNLPAELYDQVLANSSFRMPSRENSTFSDDKMYSVKNADYSIFITQRFSRNFFAEFAYNRGTEDIKTNTGLSGNMARVFIDVNKTLPTGEDNPNWGQPYSEANSGPYELNREKENYRLALGYVIDRSRLGTFSFNLIGGISEQRWDKNDFIYALKRNSDHRRWSNDTVLYRYYLYKDNEHPRPTPDSWTYVDPIAGQTTTLPAGVVRSFANAARNQTSETKYDYVQAAVSSKLFNDKLSLVAAFRIDYYKTHQEDILHQYDHPLNWDGVSRLIKQAAPSDWAALTYRLRDADGNPYGPELPANARPRISNEIDKRYLADRFQDDYSPPDQKDDKRSVSVGAVYHVTRVVSVFGNYAESFVPPAASLRLTGQLHPARLSDGWDVGVRLTFLNGNVVANLSYYEGNETNASITATTFPFNNILRAPRLNNFEAGAINDHLPLLPTGYADLADNKTTGWEFEVTANLTRNWRLMANLSLPKAVQTNQNSDSRAYFYKNIETLKRIITESGGTIDPATNVASFAAQIPDEQPNKNGGPNAATAWNTIQASLASTNNGGEVPRTRVPDVIANIYTDYTFRSGVLKGFKIGAGANYRGRQDIGSRGADTIVDPSNPTRAIDDPAYGPTDMVSIPSYTTAVFTLNYAFKIKRNIVMDIAFKIDNVFDYDKPIYWQTTMRPRDGNLSSPARVATPADYFWITPRSYQLSMALKF